MNDIFFTVKFNHIIWKINVLQNLKFNETAINNIMETVLYLLGNITILGLLLFFENINMKCLY